MATTAARQTLEPISAPAAVQRPATPAVEVPTASAAESANFQQTLKELTQMVLSYPSWPSPENRLKGDQLIQTLTRLAITEDRQARLKLACSTWKTVVKNS